MKFVNPGSTASTVRWLALLVAMIAGALLVPMTASSSPSGLFLETNLAGASAPSVAKAWLDQNKESFGLESVAGLELVSNARLASSDGHAVIFRQTFGGLDALEGGLVTVGVTGTQRGGWDIAYASSSLSKATELLGTSRLTPQEAWIRAAANVGRGVSILNTRRAKVDDGKSYFAVHGFSRPQQARLGGFPTAQGVVPAYETIFVQGDAAPSAYKHVIDARNGKVLLSENLVHQAEAYPPFMGTAGTTDGACGPPEGPYVAPAGTVSIEVVASADVPANDIVLKLLFGTAVVQAADTLTSPEAIHYEPAGGVPPGDYFVQVCEFGDGAPPTVSPLTYSGTIIVNDAAGAGIPYPPKWKVFPANPPVDNSSTDTRKTWCWDSNVNGNPIAGCDDEVGNLASRVPWDLNARTGVPTFKTEGNNARSAESWASPLTPGAPGFQPDEPAAELHVPVDERLEHAQVQPGQLRPRRRQRHRGRRRRTSSPCTTACTTGRTSSASPRRTGTPRRTTSASPRPPVRTTP